MSLGPDDAHDDLELVKATDEGVDNVPDAESKAEEADLDREAKALSNLDHRQAMSERRKFLPLIIWTPIVWSAIAVALIVLTGFHAGGFSLASGVQVALVGSCPVSAILAFGAHWIINKR